MNQCDDREEKYRVCAHRLPFPSHGLWAVVYCPTLRHLPPPSPTPFHWSSESVPFCFSVISSSRFFLSCFWMLKRCLCALVEGCTHHLCISSFVWYQIKIDLRQIWSLCFSPNCMCCEAVFLQTVRVVKQCVCCEAVRVVKQCVLWSSVCAVKLSVLWSRTVFSPNCACCAELVIRYVPLNCNCNT